MYMNTLHFKFQKTILGFFLSMLIGIAAMAQLPAGFAEYNYLNRPGIRVFAKGNVVVYQLDLSNHASFMLYDFPVVFSSSMFYQSATDSLRYNVTDPWKQRELLMQLEYVFGRPDNNFKFISASLFHTSDANCGPASATISLLPFKVPGGIQNGGHTTQAREGQKRLLGINQNAALGHQVASISNISLINPSHSPILEDYSLGFLTSVFAGTELGLIGYDPAAFITSTETMKHRVLAGQSGNFLYFMMSSSSASPAALGVTLTGFGVLASKTILLDNGISDDIMCKGDPSLNLMTTYRTSLIRIDHGN
jgi:hypothetical protein